MKGAELRPWSLLIRPHLLGYSVHGRHFVFQTAHSCSLWVWGQCCSDAQSWLSVSHVSPLTITCKVSLHFYLFPLFPEAGGQVIDNFDVWRKLVCTKSEVMVKLFYWSSLPLTTNLITLRSLLLYVMDTWSESQVTDVKWRCLAPCGARSWMVQGKLIWFEYYDVRESHFAPEKT